MLRGGGAPRMIRLVAALALVPLVAGCVYDASPDRFSEAGTQLTLTLDDIPEGHDAVLYAVRVPSGGALTLEQEWDFPYSGGMGVPGLQGEAGTGPVCLGLMAAGHEAVRGYLDLGDRHEVRIADGQGAVAALDPSHDGWQGHASEQVEVSPHPDTQAFLIAVEDADSWKAAGATWSVTLRSSSPIEWRTAETAGWDCVVGLESLDGGRLVDNGLVMHGEGLSTTFAVQDTGRTLSLVASNVGYDLTLAGPEGAPVWQDAHDETASWRLMAQHHPGLAAGDYRLDVDHFTGRYDPEQPSFVMTSMLDGPAWLAP